MSNSPSINRRQALAAVAGGTLIGPAWSGVGPQSAQALEPRDQPRRVLRFAHLTDTHMPDNDTGRRGFEACLAAVQGMDDPPELLVFGGDNVMNVDGAEGAKTADKQLANWKGSLVQHCSLPFITVIGNHDILKMDADSGKKWAMDNFGLEQRYYHTDRASWRFIVLESTTPVDGGYKGKLDEAQFDWLGKILRDTPETMPVCVISHIPILAACAYFDGNNEKSGDWRVPGAWMHIDARRIKDLFVKHPNVRLCLSGHIHLVDQVDYLGVRYCCNGAVSGGWWRGNAQEFAPGFAVVDLFDDGSSLVNFQNYEWKQA